MKNHKPTVVMTVPEGRYSDEELQVFQGIITNLLNKARLDYSFLTGEVSEHHSNGIGENLPAFTSTHKEGSSCLSKDESKELVLKKLCDISKLEGYLKQIKHKTYGIVQGRLIPREVIVGRLTSHVFS